ncbi:MAG: winged helix-turn-helix domain-containing protein [Myxococcales bacterium]|nr:winged helix-turn-helix domain-containing protein [Myxococcales bacterium]
MRAFAQLRTPDGGLVELGHGDLIGRLWSAALPLDDPRISEAHAMVSHRDGALKLLALRGRLGVGRDDVAELELSRGLIVTLARGLSLTVVAVRLPAEVLGIDAPGLGRRVLAGVNSFTLTPRPTLLPHYVPGADALIWSSGASWRVRVGDEPDRLWSVGDVITLPGLVITAVAIPVQQAEEKVTLGSTSGLRPLRIVARFDTVHLQERDQTVLTLDGVGARIISELGLLGGPVRWEVLAAELWPGAPAERLRTRLDTAIMRLRAALRDAGVRPDLVRTTGTGHVELLLHPRDELVDEV